MDARIEKGLKFLTEKQKKRLEMHLAGMSYTQIAAQEQIKRSTAQSSIRGAKKRLKTTIQRGIL